MYSPLGDAFVESLRTKHRFDPGPVGGCEAEIRKLHLGAPLQYPGYSYVCGKTLARPDIIEEIRSRMKRIDTDAICGMYTK